MNDSKLTIEFEPAFKNVDGARNTIADICQRTFTAPESQTLIMDFLLGATEAMNNAVEHSGAKKVKVDITINATDIIFKMTTEGVQFDPTANVSLPDIDSSDGLPEGGFGLAIINEMVDCLEYEYLDGKNILTLRKRVCLRKKGGGGGN